MPQEIRQHLLPVLQTTGIRKEAAYSNRNAAGSKCSSLTSSTRASTAPQPYCAAVRTLSSAQRCHQLHLPEQRSRSHRANSTGCPSFLHRHKMPVHVWRDRQWPPSSPWVGDEVIPWPQLSILQLASNYWFLGNLLHFYQTHPMPFFIAYASFPSPLPFPTLAAAVPVWYFASF